MTKRQRFILSTIFLTLLLIAVTVVDWVDMRYALIVVMSVSAGGLIGWCLWETWRGMARIATLVLPMMYALGAGLFTFLLPEIVPSIWIFNWGPDIGLWVGWGLRAVFWLVYALTSYSLFSTENIFSVSSIRMIPLARAAAAAGFLLTLGTGFLLYNAVWSFRLPFYMNAVFVMVASFPLILQGLWSIKLAERLTADVLWGTIIISVLLGEVALVLSFWPLGLVIASLTLTTVLYVLLGIAQHWLSRRLFAQTIWEYVVLSLFVFVTIVFTTPWGG